MSVLEETVYSCVCLDTVYPILLCNEEAGVILLRVSGPGRGEREERDRWKEGGLRRTRGREGGSRMLGGPRGKEVLYIDLVFSCIIHTCICATY